MEDAENGSKALAADGCAADPKASNAAGGAAGRAVAAGAKDTVDGAAENGSKAAAAVGLAPPPLDELAIAPNGSEEAAGV